MLHKTVLGIRCYSLYWGPIFVLAGWHSRQSIDTSGS